MTAAAVPERTLLINHFDVHRYVPTVHSAFVFTSFANSMRRPPRELERALARWGVVILIASPLEVPTTFLGWLAAVPTENRIICAFTKYAFRASAEQRQGKASEETDCFRIASSLAIAAGISFEAPVPCTFWSRAARKIAARPGNPYRLTHAPEEDR